MTVSQRSSSAQGAEKMIVLFRDREMRLHLREILMASFQGVDVLISDDGQEGRGLIEQHLNHISVVLVDIILRKRTGFGLVGEYAKKPRGSRPPFILLSAGPLMEVQMKELAVAGFGSFVVPRSLRELNDKVFVSCVRGVLENQSGRPKAPPEKGDCDGKSARGG